jgi:predicted DsbA family dithiol-disulfide isomerase
VSAALTETATATVEVFFDFICPWCLIGRRNLETALRELSCTTWGSEISVAWRPYVLRPETPEAGEPFKAFYERRLGSPAAVAARQSQVRAAGRAAGVEFDFARIETLPNTFAAHHLVDHAARTAGPAAADALIERLFAAYFHEGENIGDRGFLARTAKAAGLDPLAWDAESRGGLAEARAALWRRTAREVGVTGVPHYVFGGSVSVAGAQPPDVLIEALRQGR